MMHIQYFFTMSLCVMCWIICYVACVKGEHRLVVCPSRPVLATVGDTVVLPCRIELPFSATDLTTEWSRTDLKPQYVYIHRNGYAEEDRNLNELYRGQRCSVSEAKLAGGDLSLELREVQFSDDGTYCCKVPDLHSRSCSTNLHVGNVSQPEISSAGPKDDGLSLTCDSGCWYPRPEMYWLDSEGVVLAAEASVTYTPEHCYAVQSSLTARGTGRFTCRVHLAHINHTAVAHHDIPLVPGLNAGHIALCVVSALILLAAAVGAVAVGTRMWCQKDHYRVCDQRTQNLPQLDQDAGL